MTVLYTKFIYTYNVHCNLIVYNNIINLFFNIIWGIE
ncbi:hypothetical protein CoNPh17_CDS0071 [Staphylococcus phage S-CoN_Ph17]|nr:hypothetical protein CoNPh17_CDS0071 [Staphylococcus phage S-CoN_Ph17]